MSQKTPIQKDIEDLERTISAAIEATDHNEENPDVILKFDDVEQIQSILSDISALQSILCKVYKPMENLGVELCSESFYRRCSELSYSF